MADLITAGERLDHALFLERGEVSVWGEGRLLEYREAPAWLGVTALASGRPATRTVRAEGRVTVRAETPDAATLNALVLEELAREREARLDLVRSLDDFWDPEARLVPGPYAFGPFTATVVLIRSTRAHLRAVLPPGLHRIPGPAYWMLVCADLTHVRSLAPTSDGRHWRYQETTPLFPCLAEGGLPGAWVPELWPDALYPTLLGREIYGFPKRVARTRLDADGIEVIADNQRLLRGRWGAPEPVAVPSWTRWLAPRVPVYVRQRLLHRRRLSQYRTDALVCVPFTFDAPQEVVELREVALDFAPGHPILAGEPVRAWRLTTGFRFGRSRVVRDYTRRWRRA